MLHILSTKSTLLLLNHGNIDVEEFDVFLYGFSLFYSTTITAFSILLQAVLLKNILLGLIFIIYFALTRLFVGGYHAPTYGKCFVISNSLFFIIFIISSLHKNKPMFSLFTLCYVISVIFLYFYNVSEFQYKWFLKIMLTLQCVFSIIMLVAPFSKIYVSVAMNSTLSVVLFIIKSKREVKK